MVLAISTRFRLYEPVVPTSEFIVTFPLFSTDDITVTVGGAETEQYSLTANFIAGRADNAVVTLNTAVTGRVELIGAREPRRENSYLASAPDFATNLQRDIEATTAVQQEQQRDFNRSLKAPVEAGQDLEIREIASVRANRVLSFDDEGRPVAVLVGDISADAALYQALNANLTSLSGLTLAANKGLYSTGANALAMFDLTPFSRTLLDDANAAAALTTLTIPKSANADWSLDGSSISDRATTKSYVNGRTWRDETASNALDTVVTNTTGREIKVAVKCVLTDDGVALEVDGDEVTKFETGAGAGVFTMTLQADVPPGATVEAVTTSGNPSLVSWWEYK